MAASKDKPKKKADTKTTSTRGEELQAPIVQVNAQFLKDLSFEVPTPEKAFQKVDVAPKYNFNFELKERALGNDLYEVSLVFKIDATREKDTLYIVELDYTGIFTLKNIPENMLRPFLLIQCPHILFPYARHSISQITAEGGFQPLMLNPIDFGALYHQNEEKAKQSTPKKSASK